MKEEDVENLLVSYRDSLGACERRPAPKPKPLLWPRRVAFGLAASLALGVVGISLWPQNAAASTVRRIKRAIKDAKSMEVVFMVERPKGKWWTLSHTYYRDGMWRIDSNRSDNCLVKTIVRNGQQLVDYERLDHSTLSSASPNNMTVEGEAYSALEYAKSLLNTGQFSVERAVHITTHEPVDGHETYAIKMRRAEDNYTAELIVDRATDLPIFGEATLDQTTGLGKETISYRQEYRFNQPVASDLFEFRSKKPIIRLAEARAALISESSKPLIAAPGVDVRSVLVSPSGTIWIVSASPSGDLTPEKVTSDLGTEYAYGSDSMLTTDDGEPLKVEGRYWTVTSFVNPSPTAKLPTNLTVAFSYRSNPWMDYTPPKSSVKVSLRLKPVVSPDPYPGWLPLFVGDSGLLGLDVETWNARAKQLEGEHKYLAAAKTYERCALAYRDFAKRGAFFPLRSAAKCYALAGDTADSKRVAAQAEIVRQRKER